MKQKLEKEKHGKKLQTDEVKSAMDTVANEKASVEKQNRLLTLTLSDLSRKCEEANLTLQDFDNAKKKIIIEVRDIIEYVEKVEHQPKSLLRNSVIVYCRVSTTQQTKGESLNDQQKWGIEFFKNQKNDQI